MSSNCLQRPLFLALHRQRPIGVVLLTAAIVAFIAANSSTTNAQVSGSRATQTSTDNSLTELSVEQANSHIVINGNAQVRVQPTSIRLIWAVTSEGESATACRQTILVQIDRTVRAFKDAGLKDKDISEDFISAIPKFTYDSEQQGGEYVLVEKESGFRMQTNLHVSVADHEQAMKIIDAALKSGVTDLIGADYNADLESARKNALKQATEAAKAKSELMLSALFEKQPALINVQEQTKTFFPADMYDSFENASHQQVYSAYRSNSNLRRIEAYRPQNTYYKGLKRAADKRDYGLAMKPEIVIESTVNLYFRSPGMEQYLKAEQARHHVDPTTR